MIPQASDDLRRDFVFREQSSETYKLHLDDEIIAGRVNGIEAMKQAIYLILNVERYRYIIYSWSYGVELVDLIGQPTSFCLPEIKRRITEALLQDSRITDVGDFRFEVRRGVVHTTFAVTTIFGAIEQSKEVSI